MRSKYIVHIIWVAAIVFSSCCLPPLLDVTGRGCPQNCLYLDVESMTVVNECGREKISAIRVFVNNNDRKNRSHFACDEYIDEPVDEHVLSIPNDSLQNRTADIYVSYQYTLA